MVNDDIDAIIQRGEARTNELNSKYEGLSFEDLSNFSVGFFFSKVGSVTLLPQEFTSTEERLRILKLPSDDAIPLVEFERKIPMTLDPLCIV